MLLATIIGSAAGLALDLYANGLLSIDDYGRYGAWRRLLLFAGLFCQAGMENVVLREVATGAGEHKFVRIRAALTGTVGLALFTGAVLVLAAAPLAEWLDGGPDGVRLVMIGAISLPFAAVRLVAVSGSQGLGVLRHRAVVMFLAWPAGLALGFGVLTHGLGLGLLGAALGYLGSMAFGAVLSLVQLLRLEPRAVGLGGLGVFGGLLAVGWPLWLQSFLGATSAWADQVLLAGIRSAADAGVYGPVATLVPLFGMGLGALNQSFAPEIARRHHAGDHTGLKHLYQTVARWALVVTLPPSLVCLVLPEVVLGLWPNGDPAASTALRLCAGASLFGTAVGSVNYLLIMSGRPRAALLNAALAAGGSLLFSFLLIPRYGVTGAALANVSATLLSNGVGLLAVGWTLGMWPFHRQMLKVLVVSIGVGIALWPLRSLDLSPWLVGPAAGALATAALVAGLVLSGLNDDDREALSALRQKLGRRIGG